MKEQGCGESRGDESIGRNNGWGAESELGGIQAAGFDF